MQRRIILYPLEQPAIIVKAKTGLIYTNQTNGVGCSHHDQEGFLVLLGTPSKRHTVFSPDRWYKEMPLLDDALYNEIEAALNGEYTFNWHVHDVRVDRTAHNEEAWIYVTFRGDFETKHGSFRANTHHDPEYDQFPVYEGILTWENCD